MPGACGAFRDGTVFADTACHYLFTTSPSLPVTWTRTLARVTRARPFNPCWRRARRHPGGNFVVLQHIPSPSLGPGGAATRQFKRVLYLPASISYFLHLAWVLFFLPFYSVIPPMTTHTLPAPVYRFAPSSGFFGVLLMLLWDAFLSHVTNSSGRTGVVVERAVLYTITTTGPYLCRHVDITLPRGGDGGGNTRRNRAYLAALPSHYTRAV